MTAPVRQAELEDRLRNRLGLRPLGERLDPAARLWGWLGPLAVTALAAALRLVRLDHPGRLVFDETYYVKQAFSLLELGYEGQWPAEGDEERRLVNERFAAGDTSDLSTEAENVVHPPVGKWMIAIGLLLFRADSGLGWRFSAAVTGALAVLVLARLATRLFGSAALGTTAGLLLALDGVHLTTSRTAILDGFLTFWILVGLWCVVRDRESSRARLARRAAASRMAEESGAPSSLVRGTGFRWWLVAAGVALGLACGVKWSGAYAVAVFGLLTFAWDLAARRAVAERHWLSAGALRGGVPAFVALVPTAALTYLASWVSWFANPRAYRRQWAAELTAAGETVPRAWLPDALNSWWAYHRATWDFHTSLDSEHPYQSHPAAWLLQLRPTSFYWADPGPPPTTCGAERCVEAVTNLGNPALWWLGLVALGALLYLAVTGRDWRAWAVLAGYAATYLPWFAYTDRTIFGFYSVAFAPYVALCLTFVLGWGTGLLCPPPHPRGWLPAGPAAAARSGRHRLMSPSPAARFLADDGAVRLTTASGAILGTVLGLTVVAALFFFPVWTGMPISYDAWHARMWLPSWI